jgi:hypothetical protein
MAKLFRVSISKIVARNVAGDVAEVDQFRLHRVNTPATVLETQILFIILPNVPFPSLFAIHSRIQAPRLFFFGLPPPPDNNRNTTAAVSPFFGSKSPF